MARRDARCCLAFFPSHPRFKRLRPLRLPAAVGRPCRGPLNEARHLPTPFIHIFCFSRAHTPTHHRVFRSLSMRRVSSRSLTPRQHTRRQHTRQRPPHATNSPSFGRSVLASIPTQSRLRPTPDPPGPRVAPAHRQASGASPAWHQPQQHRPQPPLLFTTARASTIPLSALHDDHVSPTIATTITRATLSAASRLPSICARCARSRFPNSLLPRRKATTATR